MNNLELVFNASNSNNSRTVLLRDSNIEIEAIISKSKNEYKGTSKLINCDVDISAYMDKNKILTTHSETVFREGAYAENETKDDARIIISEDDTIAIFHHLKHSISDSTNMMYASVENLISEYIKQAPKF